MTTGPDVAFSDTWVVRLVVPLTESAAPRFPLNVRRLSIAAAPKLVPVTVIAVPAVPMLGGMFVIVGAPQPSTGNQSPLVADPLPTVTRMGPVVAPVGTYA